MTASQALSITWLTIFVCGATLAGLAAIHFIWLNPVVIGPFGLIIGMTPLVLLFEHSLEVPASWFPIGVLCSGASWLMLRRNPPRPVAAKVVFIGGGALVGLAMLTFLVASVYYNVGMAGPVPAGWYAWVRPGAKLGEVGVLLLAIGFLAMGPSSKSGASDGI